MGIYIKSMEIPTGCGVCPFSDDECFGAWKCWCVKDWGNDDNRAKGCPLVSVQPHGRLVDADKVLDELAHNLGIRSLDYLTPSEWAIVSWFRDAPTIIDAEEGAA